MDSLYDQLHKLEAGLAEHLKGELTLQDIEDKLTTPIIVHDNFERLDEDVQALILFLDSWEIEEFKKEDIKNLYQELQNTFDARIKFSKYAHQGDSLVSYNYRRDFH